MERSIVLPPGASQLECWAALPASDRAERIRTLAPDMVASWEWNWKLLGREAQQPPDGDWRTWLILAGRGFGKTRAGAEWVRKLAETGKGLRIALVGASLVEARSVMVEGESGLLAIAPPGRRPTWEASLRRLTWPDGAVATLYSAGEPDSLRGPQHHFAWCDEIGKWPKGLDAWTNLKMGLRLGRDPQVVVTTTPRAVPLLRMLVADGAAVVTRGRTSDNRGHLARSFMEDVHGRYGGTLTGRQELDGELIEAIEGALWSRPALEAARVAKAPPLARVVVGVDPPAGAGAASDACGIVVAGLGEDGRAYVLADASVQGAAPEGWARAVADAAAVWGADRVVAEANNGGAMVASVLRAADAVLPLALVHASHGKSARAEPVQALYAGGRAFHVGAFAQLEDEMAGLLVGGGYEGPGRSPDRADALVWALTELMLRHRPARPGVRGL